LIILWKLHALVKLKNISGCGSRVIHRSTPLWKTGIVDLIRHLMTEDYGDRDIDVFRAAARFQG
jgi:hypothetical protein